MKLTIATLGAAAFALSACATIPAAPLPVGPVTVTTASKAPFGTYLIDSAGRSLYILEGTRNESGMSRCNADCLRVWPPLHLADRLSVGLELIPRDWRPCLCMAHPTSPMAAGRYTIMSATADREIQAASTSPTGGVRGI